MLGHQGQIIKIFLSDEAYTVRNADRYHYISYALKEGEEVRLISGLKDDIIGYNPFSPSSWKVVTPMQAQDLYWLGIRDVDLCPK